LGLNALHIRSEKVASIRICTDTAVLQKILDRLAAKGMDKARAAPIASSSFAPTYEIAPIQSGHYQEII